MIILLQSSTLCLCNAFFDLHTFFFSIKEFVPHRKLNVFMLDSRKVKHLSHCIFFFYFFICNQTYTDMQFLYIHSTSTNFQSCKIKSYIVHTGAFSVDFTLFLWISRALYKGCYK